MSDSGSTNTGDGDREEELPSIAEALFDLCTSDELSITALHETINNPGLSTNYKNSFNRSYDTYNRDKTLFVVHHACDNKNVTLEIIEFLLNNNIRSFPDAAQVLSTEFLTRQGDETSTSETYPLHIACSNKHCPSDVIRFLIEQYSPACEHVSDINGGVHYGAYQVAGLPIHYYLARNRNVDIDTVKVLVEAYPQSLLITDEEDDEDEEEACYPIHAILSNEKTNNIHEILSYMLELEPSSIQLLDGRGSTPLHVACQSKRANLAIVAILFNAWPEAIRMRNDRGWFFLFMICATI